MSQVNLLPPEFLARAKTRRLTSAIMVAGAIVLVMVIGFWFLKVTELSGVNDDIAAQQQTNQDLQQQVADLNEFAELQQEALQKQTLLAAAYQGEVSFSGFLMDISRAIPSDAYLTNLDAQLTDTGSATGTTGTTGTTTTTTSDLIGSFTTDGEAAGFNSLASWLGHLEDVRGWVNPWFTAINETADNSGLYAFTSSTDMTTEAQTKRGSEESSDASG